MKNSSSLQLKDPANSPLQPTTSLEAYYAYAALAIPRPDLAESVLKHGLPAALTWSSAAPCTHSSALVCSGPGRDVHGLVSVVAWMIGVLGERIKLRLFMMSCPH